MCKLLAFAIIPMFGKLRKIKWIDGDGIKKEHFEPESWGWNKNTAHDQKQPLETVCNKKVFMNIFQISLENTCVEVSFSIKFQALKKISGLLPKKVLIIFFVISRICLRKKRFMLTRGIKSMNFPWHILGCHSAKIQTSKDLPVQSQ